MDRIGKSMDERNGEKKKVIGLELFDVVGYIGMIFLLLGIGLVRKKGYALYSDICIVIGDIGLIANCLYYGALPATLVNTIIVFLTFFNIRKDLRERRKKDK